MRLYNHCLRKLFNETLLEELLQTVLLFKWKCFGICRLLLLLTSLIYCLELIHSNYYTDRQQDEV